MPGRSGGKGAMEYRLVAGRNVGWVRMIPGDQTREVKLSCDLIPITVVEFKGEEMADSICG